MSFFSRLRSASSGIHKDVGTLPFLQRYHSDELRLIDHYLHLCQLLPLYEMLEQKLKNPAVTIKLPDEMYFLLERSEELRKDIQFLENKIPPEYKKRVCKSTHDYEEFLKNCQDERVIYGHFLARILGDLFGGQRIRARLKERYVTWEMTTLDSDQGLAFYTFPDGVLRDLLRLLNKENKPDNADDQVIIDAVKDGIARHIPIFNELELDRERYRDLPKNVHLCGLFSGRNALAAGIAALGVASVAYLYSRQPN